MIPLAQPDLSGRELEYTTQAIKSGWISSQGEFVPRFENAVAARHGPGFHGVACSSGTAALHLALLAAGIKRGDKVLIPDLTFAATMNVVLHVGAEPVLVDVDQTMCMSAVDVMRALREFPGVKAIIPVFLYGNIPDLRLWEIAEKFKLTVIEDRCECVQFLPPTGHYICYSYYANKAITTGEGGMVVTRWPEAVRRYRDHGMVRPYYHLVPGLNYRMTNVAAAIGCAQMERFDVLYGRRLGTLKRFHQAIPNGQGEWMYVVQKKPMRAVETRPVFDPLHTMPYIMAGQNFPSAIRFHHEMMCLPTGPHLSSVDVEEIIREYATA